MPGLGLGKRQQGVTKFVENIEPDPVFGLGYVPKEEDWARVSAIHRGRSLARRLGIPFDYPTAPIRGSLMEYFTKSKTHLPHSLPSQVWVDEITGEIVPSFEALFGELHVSDVGGSDALVFELGSTNHIGSSSRVLVAQKSSITVVGLSPLAYISRSSSSSSILSLHFLDFVTDESEFMDGAFATDDYQCEVDDMTLGPLVSEKEKEITLDLMMISSGELEAYDSSHDLVHETQGVVAEENALGSFEPFPVLMSNDSVLITDVGGNAFATCVESVVASDPILNTESVALDVLVSQVNEMNVSEYSFVCCDNVLLNPNMCMDRPGIFVCNLDESDPLDSDDESMLDQPPQELTRTVESHENRAQPIMEDTEIIDLGTKEQPKEIQIGTSLSQSEKSELIELLESYLDVFAWSYEDMPGLDPNIVQHHLPLLPDAKPIKQKLRRMNSKWSVQVKEEIEKQVKAGFLRVIEYSDWLANIVPVAKKDGRVRMCVDYRDLNKASPKDDFPLPHIDMLVDATAGHALFSFMDGFSG